MMMLDAGGHPVWGEPPDYEPKYMPYPPEYIDVAVKTLVPHRFGVPLGCDRFIWLDRNVHEQAKSQVKMAEAKGMMVKQYGRNMQPVERLIAVQTAEKNIPMERSLALGALVGYKLMYLTYELIVTEKRRTAERVAKFTGRKLDVDAMVEMVIDRDTKCLDRMAEVDMLMVKQNG